MAGKGAMRVKGGTVKGVTAGELPPGSADYAADAANRGRELPMLRGILPADPKGPILIPKPVITPLVRGDPGESEGSADYGVPGRGQGTPGPKHVPESEVSVSSSGSADY